MEAGLALASVGAVLIVLAAQLMRRYLPRQYFALADVVYGVDSRVTWGGVAIRFSIPLVVGTGVAVVAPDDPVVVAGTAGLWGAAFLVSPNILRPELTIQVGLLERKAELYLVYGMFVAAYTLIALSGGFLGDYLRQVAERALDRDLLAGVVDRAGSLILSVVGSLIGGLLVVLFTRRVRGVERR